MSILKLEERTSTLEIFPGTSISTLEIFECTLRFRSTFKYVFGLYHEHFQVLKH